MIDDNWLAHYRAAHESAALANISDWGWIRLTGRDRLDLLHRLSTHDLKKLGAGQGAPTVFTSATGRVMAFLTVYGGEGDVLVRTMPGQGAGVTRYLKSMIFWQDQVEVTDLTAEMVQFAVYGPRARSLLEEATGQQLGALQPYEWRAAILAGQPVTLHRAGSLEAPAWFVTSALTAHEPVLDALTVPQLDAGMVDVLRVEAGLPIWGRELSEQVTPLETGLLPAINFNKGCYTGQEVIARQTNYDKVTRNLVGLEFGPTGAPVERATGAAATAEPLATVRGPGRGGFVGSVAYSPSLDKVIGLAIVPRELAQPGTQVEVAANDQVFTATVRSLPFVSTN